MDKYASTMIARGPTMSADRTVATGSLHIVDLPDWDAARAFAFEEPNYKAGVYDDVLIRRWRNRLGRTMWEFSGASAGFPRFLIIGRGIDGSGVTEDLQSIYFSENGFVEHLIASGPLLSDDGTEWPAQSHSSSFPTGRRLRPCSRPSRTTGQATTRT